MLKTKKIIRKSNILKSVVNEEIFGRNSENKYFEKLKNNNSILPFTNQLIINDVFWR